MSTFLTPHEDERSFVQGSHSVAWFDYQLEKALFYLMRVLQEKRYQPGAYRQFVIYERKPRVISAAPFQDRVIHHGVMNWVEPYFDRHFIHHSYACRQGKGTHKAVDQYQQWAKRFSYVLKLDIKQYFPSIDRDILKNQLRHLITEPNILELFDTIIDSSPDYQTAQRTVFPQDDLWTPILRPTGIPIGNLTSQYLANFYLNELDHWLLNQQRVPAYLRYVDDLIIFADNKAFLHRLIERIRRQLESLRLILHPKKIHVYRCSEKVDVFGYSVARHKRWLRPDNGYRFQRRLKRLAIAYHQGRVDWKTVNQRVQSWLGHASYGETAGLRQAIFDAVTFHAPVYRPY